MPEKEQLIKRLDTVIVPGAMRSLPDMNMIKEIKISDHHVDFWIAAAALNSEVQEWLTSKIVDSVKGYQDIIEVKVTYVDTKPKDINQVGKVLAVMSGKGGVGKSLVAALAAIALKRLGYSVGILDGDITGPSIPKMFGLFERPAGSESGFIPVPSHSGVPIMSVNLLLPSEDDAVIWRGPLIAKAITQFWEDVLWGKLDFLLVDLPPGTADAPLTALQSLPVSGVIIVFTPQDLTAMVVRKAVKMAQQLSKPVIGVVENMSYLHIPELNKNIEIFGRSHADEMARNAAAPLLARIPIDPQLAQLCDDGNIEKYDTEIVRNLGQSLIKSVAEPG